MPALGGTRTSAGINREKREKLESYSFSLALSLAQIALKLRKPPSAGYLWGELERAMSQRRFPFLFKKGSKTIKKPMVKTASEPSAPG